MLKLCTYSAVLCENILYISKRQKYIDWTQTFGPHCMYVCMYVYIKDIADLKILVVGIRIVIKVIALSIL